MTAALTDEQVVAAATDEPRVNIEASPGSGKTTVAAERYGYLLYRELSVPKAVVAVSFTRSATWVLRRRVIARWGRGAVDSPNRVVTLDTIFGELISFLLSSEHLRWPGGHTDLTVDDSWQARAPHVWTRRGDEIALHERDVVVRERWHRTRRSRVEYQAYGALISQGICTHEEVREVVRRCLREPVLREVIRGRLRSTLRALIVDEIYDANELDLELVSLSSEAGVEVTLIGDPWQALYRFRGATPALVSPLVKELDYRTVSLSESFRFVEAETRQLAADLRAGNGVVVPNGDAASVDVVLARWWSELWEVGDLTLPLAHGRPKSIADAANTLLLDYATTNLVGERGVFVTDALTKLGITDLAAVVRLRPAFREVIRLLQGGDDDTEAAKAAWRDLVKAFAAETRREFPARIHPTHYRPLMRLRQRLVINDARFTPGMTIHQAKGREWNRVGVRLSAADRAQLLVGLDPNVESHRALYVALTRGSAATRCV